MITWLFPVCCPVCLKPVLPRGSRIHALCSAKISVISEPMCKRCGRPITDETAEYCEECATTTFAWNSGHCLYPYQSAIKEAILKVKQEGTKEFVQFFGAELAITYQTYLQKVRPECIVPIPLHKRKMRRRGFNQAELLAAELEKLTGIPMKLLLVKTINTKDQKTLTGKQRKLNLSHAFSIDQEFVQADQLPQSVLLVDDVYTTGSTINACATVLKQAGVSYVYFLCVCSNVLEDSEKNNFYG